MLIGSKCYDIDECVLNSGKGLCSYICINYVGWYKCECFFGYYFISDYKICHVFDCNSFVLFFNLCL